MYNYMNHDSINWVQGVEGAKAYPLMPGANTILMDSENEGMFYIKACDNVGMCNLRMFKFQEVHNAKPDYITRDELMKALEDLRNERLVQQPTQPASTEPAF